MGNEDSGRRRKRLIVVCVCVAVLLLCALAYFFYYQNMITAVTMRIQRLVGTVNLYNEEGSEQSLREKIRLGAGQTIKTAGESLIMVSLDDTKLMTMEESSRANIRAKGKHLEFDLLEGNLFFNVTEKLGDNESFDINTTTMVCGIRGTSAYIGKDATGHEVLMVTDGLVHVVATNPVTLESIEEDVKAPQMRTVYLDDEAEGNATISFGRDVFKEEDLPAMALDTMRKNPELLDRVSKATGFSTKKLITLADLSCTKGVSMYGSAAGELAAEGIEDAIPYLGSRAGQMVDSANSAVDIAKDDLPLEVAIIQGYRDVMDTVSPGYSDEEVDEIMDSTRSCVEDTFVSIDAADLSAVDRLSAGMSVTDSLRIAGMRMSDAKNKLSSSEIAQVTDAVSTLYTRAIDDAVASSTSAARSSSVLGAVGRISDHVTNVVTVEMGKMSNGDRTVEALFAGDSSSKGSGRKSTTKDDDKKIIEEAKTSAKVPDLGDGSQKNTDSTSGSNASSADDLAAQAALVQAMLAAATPTPTPVPEWLWKQWQQEQEESSGSSEEEPEPAATPTPTPAPGPTPNASFDGNGNIILNGRDVGRVSTTSTTPKFAAKKAPPGTPVNQSFVDLPIVVQDQATKTVYQFNTLLDVDWAQSEDEAIVRDTNHNGDYVRIGITHPTAPRYYINNSSQGTAESMITDALKQLYGIP